MHVEGRVIQVDTTRYDLTLDDDAVVLDHLGNMRIDRATLSPESRGLGKRFGLTYREPEPGTRPDVLAVRSGVWIVGAVVREMGREAA